MLLLGACRLPSCEGSDAEGDAEVSVDFAALRAERPALEFAAIYAKRTQLIRERFLAGDRTMCPQPDAGTSSSTSTGVKAALRDLAAESKKLVKQLGIEKLRASPLHVAAFLCQVKAVEAALAARAKIEALDDRGLTALHWASCAEVARVLLKAGANVRAASERGITPLHLAMTAPVARVLIEAGANLEARDACGNRPLHTAAYFGLRAYRRSAEPAPSVAGDPELPLWLKALLLLLEATNELSRELVAFFDVSGALEAAGADGTALNGSGKTPEVVFDVSSGGVDFD